MNQIFDAANSRHAPQAILHNGRTLPNDLLESVRAQVTKKASLLIPEVSYTLKQICGDIYWKHLSDGDKNQAGWCMSHLVMQGIVPFIHVGFTSANSKLYQRL